MYKRQVVWLFFLLLSSVVLVILLLSLIHIWVRPIFKPTKTIQQFLRPVKDCQRPALVVRSVWSSLHMRPVVHRNYEKQCPCPHWWTQRLLSFETAGKSAIAEHALASADHRVPFDEMRLLSSVSSYYPRLQKKSLQIQKHAYCNKTIIYKMYLFYNVCSNVANVCLLYTSRCV